MFSQTALVNTEIMFHLLISAKMSSKYNNMTKYLYIFCMMMDSIGKKACVQDSV